jgi:hypothetical protein
MELLGDRSDASELPESRVRAAGQPLLGNRLLLALDR